MSSEIIPKSDDGVVFYTRTMELRFLGREVDLSAFYSPRTAISYVLQQRWQGSDGSSRWEDVPYVKDEPTP